MLSLQASIANVHVLRLLYVEPIKLLNFDYNADPIKLPKSMRIRICNPAKIM
jgi:hypothetical protein